MFNLDNIELKQNIKFPKEYRQLCQSDFIGVYKDIEIHINDDFVIVRKFLTATEINDLLDEFYDFWGYDIIPIAETDYEDYICLYYKENKENPSIIYWDYELALENITEGIFFLYGSMKEFLSTITKL